ncbi:MAG: hypothetical protein ACJAVK_001864 [Akkermansiaceae bacterium]|jgi:hypothetical protein
MILFKQLVNTITLMEVMIFLHLTLNEWDRPLPLVKKIE